MTLRTVTPAELTASDASASPRRFRVHPERVSMYASRLGLRAYGPDLEIDSFRPLSALDQPDREDRQPLTYLTARRFAPALVGRCGLTVVTTPALQACVPQENAVLLTNEDPRSTFYSIMGSARCLGLFECLETFISGSAKISPSAVISPNVYVADQAEIGPGAVLFPNTYVGPGVVIKPNAVIGGEGFEVVTGKGRRLVRHAGGVWLAAGASVGSSTCIDRGLFGDFTEIGSYTFLDNMVNVGHCARTGSFCSIIAFTAILGSVILEEGVWVGPHVSILQNLRVGKHSYIGTGSIVTRDIDSYTLVYGSPAQPRARVCECRAKLSFDEGRAECEGCSKQYVLASGSVQPR